MPKADIFPQQKPFALGGEHNLLKISSMKAFFHIPLLQSKHPVNNILQELINHQPHKKKKSPFCFLRIGQNWFLMIGQLFWVSLYKIDWGYLLQTQFSRLMDKTFLVTGSSPKILSNLFCAEKQKEHGEIGEEFFSYSPPQFDILLGIDVCI